jgi:SAM-dependent methyltransferase
VGTRMRPAAFPVVAARGLPSISPVTVRCSAKVRGRDPVGMPGWPLHQLDPVAVGDDRTGAQSGGLAVQTFVMEGPISRHRSVRWSYDAVAKEYATGFRGELAGKPLDRALLACLAEQAEDGAPIADLGCGPGHVAAWLAGRGVAAVGIDLSPGMIAVGRREYPQVEFREGDFLELPAADGEFGAAIAFYSIIHLEPGELSRAFQEIHRVLRPHGLFLVSFHIGSEVRHLDEWWAHAVDVDFRFFEPPSISAAIERAGFCTEMRLERVSYPGEVETRRAYLLARREP